MGAFEKYSDFDVVRKIVAGEVALFEIIIRRHNAALYKIGRSYNYDHADTQDIMQDTYLNAYMYLAKFEYRSSFKTWIIKLMLNNCYKRQQKWSFKNVIPTEINEQSEPVFSNNYNTDTNNAVMNKELNYVIEEALYRVPVDYRLVFTLREINGLNITETAESLNISEANVKVRLNRAKTMLRKEVEKSYTPEDIFEFNLIYCDAMAENVMNKIRQMKPAEG